MSDDRRKTARNKIVKMLPRLALERLSGLTNPLYANRSDLVDHVMTNWNQEEVTTEVLAVLRRAE